VRQPKFFEIEALINRLATVPALIAHAIERWREMELHIPPIQGEWSVADVFAHMRAVDDLWIPRVYAIVIRDRPSLTAYDERRWAEVVGYAHADFHSSLTLYTLRRAELVRMLHHIGLNEWQRIGMHEEYGPISLFDIIKGWVEHEEEHYAQLAAICNR